MKRLRKKRRYRHEVTRKARALTAWLKRVRSRAALRACRPTPVSARYSRLLKYTLRKAEPELHKEMKVAFRAKRILDRKLNGARVTWARKLWMRRRVAEGKGTNDRHFQGAFRPSPRTSAKWVMRKLLKEMPNLIDKRGNTRTPSPKGYRRTVRAKGLSLADEGQRTVKEKE